MVLDSSGFGIIGGDRRQLALAESIAADGFRVLAYGFENAEFTGQVQKADLQETTKVCDKLLLPLPVTADGRTLKAEFAQKQIPLNDTLAQQLKGHMVFGGKVARALQACPQMADLQIRDYSVREDFAVRNAAVTAEGAIAYAMREYAGTINGSRCLIAGAGRIGSQLAPRLRALGADVTATYRRAVTAAHIEAMGCHALPVEKLAQGGSYEIIFNTVPAEIFTDSVLTAFACGTLLIDLSSAPGGVDMVAAGKHGIRALHAFALPAKVAPRTAGEIIKQTVYQMMKE